MGMIVAIFNKGGNMPASMHKLKKQHDVTVAKVTAMWGRSVVVSGRAGRWRRAALWLTAAAALLLLLQLLGVFQKLSELDYHSQFTYPLDSDVGLYVELLLSGRPAPVTPLNRHQFRYIELAADRCRHDADAPPLQLLMVVKSAVDNFVRRRAIRAAWAEQRPGVQHVFMLGTRAGQPDLQRAVQSEAAEFGDIVQAHFEDAYYNNTLKTMSGLRWAVEQCADAELVFFVDDDMYVSVPNVLRLARERSAYPRRQPEVVPPQLPTDQSLLLAGYVFHSAPHRHRFSKWFVSVDEYPFNLWPPYCTAGAYLVSRKALPRLLYTSYYTKLFRFDDIYIGLVAKKAGIVPLHTEYVRFWETAYSPEEYRHVVAAHGYHEPDQLLEVWRDQRRLGHA